jgi:hypothetical protein
MRGKLAKLFWLLVALSHGWFFASLLGRGDALDFGTILRLVGLVLTIAFAVAELTGRGWIGANIARLTRRDALACCLVVALLHAGAAERSLSAESASALPQAAAVLATAGAAALVSTLAFALREVFLEAVSAEAPRFDAPRRTDRFHRLRRFAPRARVAEAQAGVGSAGRRVARSVRRFRAPFPFWSVAGGSPPERTRNGNRAT